MNFTVNYGIYPFDVMFSFGESDAQVKEHLKKQGVRDQQATYKLASGDLAITVHYDNGFNLIRMRELPATPRWHSVLSHEVFHAVTNLMRHIGAKLSESSEESYAYAIQFLIEQVYLKVECTSIAQADTA